VSAVDYPEPIGALVLELHRAIETGAVRGVALVTIAVDGGLMPAWAADLGLGPHVGSVLRGAVAYLAARMDAAALTT